MSTARCIDESQARRFLTALGRGDDVFVFQTFDDDATRKSRELSRVLVGSLDQHLQQLNYLQQQGAGVYVQVNAGHGRGKDHITYGRALFVDADDPDEATEVMQHIKDQLPVPSAVVLSSEGKFHAYWWTSTTTDTISDTMSLLADAAGTDPSMKNVDRVMRLPGSWHQKNPDKPVQVELMRCVATEHEYSGLLGSIMHADKRGAKVKAGGSYVTAVQYDPEFGLPISASDDMEVLASGGRTEKLVSYIGRLVEQGYGADYIKKEIRRIAAERLPEGDTPISEKALEQEIFPAIYRFQGKHGEYAVQSQPVPAPRPTTPVPGMPEAPVAQPAAPLQAPPAATGVPAGLNDPRPASMEAVSERPNTNMPLEVWEDRFVWIETGQWVVDTAKPLVSGKFSAADFDKARKNHRVGEGLMFSKWLASHNRRTAFDFKFKPGAPQLFIEHDSVYYNLYEPPKDLKGAVDPDQLTVWEDHMTYLFQDPGTWYRMTNWFIFTLQSPQIRVPWAPLLVSKQGTGKTWVFECLKACLDGQYANTVTAHDLEKQQFNEHMSNSLVVCYEEVHTRNKHEVMNALKPIVTNTTLEINHKFGKKGQEEVFANVFMTSNYDDALAIQFDDLRRYFVYRIWQPPVTDDAAKRLYQWLGTDGPKHLYHWCLQVDQSDWQYNRWPEVTPAFEMMCKANMSVLKRALTECVEDRIGVFQCDIGDEAQVEETLRMYLDQDKINMNQKKELQHLLREHSEPLRRVKDGKRWRRLMVWRREEVWNLQPDMVLIKEYKRAQSASTGAEAPPTLEQVEGGQS